MIFEVAWGSALWGLVPTHLWSLHLGMGTGSSGLIDPLLIPVSHPATKHRMRVRRPLESQGSTLGLVLRRAFRVGYHSFEVTWDARWAPPGRPPALLCRCLGVSLPSCESGREEGSGRRPRQEAPGHRRLRRPPSPPSPSLAFASSSRLPRPLARSLLRSPRLPSALPALSCAPRLLRPAPCGAAAAGGSSCPQMWAGRRAGNFRAGCECGAPAAVGLPWIRRREPLAACSAPLYCCCYCCRRRLSCCCRRRPRAPGSSLPRRPQVGANRVPIPRDPPATLSRPASPADPSSSIVQGDLGKLCAPRPGAKLANFGSRAVAQGAHPGCLGTLGALEHLPLSGCRVWRRRAGKTRRRSAQNQHQRVQGSQGEAVPGDAREEPVRSAPPAGPEYWLGRPRGVPRRLVGPCSTHPRV